MPAACSSFILSTTSRAVYTGTGLVKLLQLGGMFGVPVAALDVEQSAMALRWHTQQLFNSSIQLTYDV